MVPPSMVRWHRKPRQMTADDSYTDAVGTGDGARAEGREPQRGRPQAGFVAELEGLRGVAILLVVLFHAHLLGGPSGFVGVDVFFVLSGFLITALLVRELEERGRINLSAFYVRRARRILPASLLVILLTVAAGMLLASPLDVPGIASDGAAAALSAGNIQFALRAVDYFAQDQAPSPLLHYWSLGVEEQFYLVWPFVFVLIGALAMRFEAVRRQPRIALGVLLGAITIASLVAGIVVTSISQPMAFYLLPTRAWELGLGGLLAVGARPIASLRAPVRLAAGWIGLAIVIGSAFLIPVGTLYPGTAALIPTIGSALVIVSTIGRSAAPSILRARPIRFLGLISFSLYLVHWPIFTLAQTAWLSATMPPLGPDGLTPTMPVPMLLGLVALSVVVAAVSYQVVERPFHRGFAIRGWSLGRVRPRWILANAALAMTFVVAGSLVLQNIAERELDGGNDTAWVVDVIKPGESPGETPGPTDPRVTPGASDDPSTPHPPTAQPSPQTSWPPIVAAGGPLPADVEPRLSRARDDWDALFKSGCGLDNLETQIVECVYGDPDGTRTMALVGDSHAQMWFPALNQVAKANQWRLVPMTKFSCRFLDLPMFSEILQRPFTECETWKGAVIERLNQLKPDLTVVVIAHGMTVLKSEHADPVVQGNALARYLERFPGEKAVIVDAPWLSFDVPACLASHRSDVSACASARNAVAGPRLPMLEKTATEASGALLVDMTDRTCTSDICPAVIDGIITYRDNQHYTATFSRWLAPVLGARLGPLLVGD